VLSAEAAETRLNAVPNLADLLQHQEPWTEAADAWRSAWKEAAGDERATFAVGLGDAHAHLGQYDAAATAHHTAIEIAASQAGLRSRFLTLYRTNQSQSTSDVLGERARS